MRITMADTEVVARFYEGVFDESALRDGLAELARLLGGYSGMILFKDHGVGRPFVLAEVGADPNDTNAYLNYYRALNPFERLFGNRSEGDVFAPGHLAFTPEYQRTEFFADWARRRGYGDFIGCHIMRRPSEYAWLSIRRRLDRGPFSPQDVCRAKRIIPHVRRAVSLWAEGQSRTALHSSVEEAFQLFDVAVILVDTDGQIVWANRSADAIFRRGDGLTSQRGRIAAPSHHDTERLRALIKEHARPLANPFEITGGVDMVVPVGESARPLSVHIVKLTQRQPLPSRAVVALFVVDPEKGQRSVSAFCAAYELTAAEGRLLAQLIEGRKVRAAATMLGIADLTARTHLKRILGKTGTTRQAELLSLFFTSSLPPFINDA